MNRKISVVGLGYVGLPLAVAFGKKIEVLGFDIDADRVKELKEGFDRTEEIESEVLKASNVRFSCDPASLKESDFIIVAVPTPIDDNKQPDLTPLDRASRTIGANLSAGAIVVYESTVYPGVTEDYCAPILEELSGLKCGVDFHIGYSPERINPGDKERTIDKIVKVVAGQTPEITKIAADVYNLIVDAGTYCASSIKTAEAAKVIENTQRDLNIALVNELSMIFDRMDIDTLEVLEAAGTKWNFLPFRPGLVGGHCIGVDPYYLTHKAQQLGYLPQVILAGRRINDGMGAMIARKTVKLMIKAGINPKGAKVGILGLTFKENVPDLRNTRVVDIIAELNDFNIETIVYDPVADAEEAKTHLGVTLADESEMKNLDGIILAVAHEPFKKGGTEWIRSLVKHNATIIDVKSIYTAKDFDEGISFWRL